MRSLESQNLHRVKSSRIHFNGRENFLSIYSTETEKKKVNLSMYQKVVENC